MNTTTQTRTQTRIQKHIKTEILPKSQINRIIDRYNPKHKQQKTNLKKKLIDGNYSTQLTKLLIQEILFLNGRVLSEERLDKLNNTIDEKVDMFFDNLLE